jgi:hypothetical protein
MDTPNHHCPLPGHLASYVLTDLSNPPTLPSDFVIPSKDSFASPQERQRYHRLLNKYLRTSPIQLLTERCKVEPEKYSYPLSILDNSLLQKHMRSLAQLQEERTTLFKEELERMSFYTNLVHKNGSKCSYPIGDAVLKLDIRIELVRSKIEKVKALREKWIASAYETVLNRFPKRATPVSLPKKENKKIDASFNVDDVIVPAPIPGDEIMIIKGQETPIHKCKSCKTYLNEIGSLKQHIETMRRAIRSLDALANTWKQRHATLENDTKDREKKKSFSLFSKLSTKKKEK